MLAVFKNFLRNDGGAIAVDWVVLTAAVVTLAGVVMVSIISASGEVGDKTGTYLTEISVLQ